MGVCGWRIKSEDPKAVPRRRALAAAAVLAVLVAAAAFMAGRKWEDALTLGMLVGGPLCGWAQWRWVRTPYSSTGMRPRQAAVFMLASPGIMTLLAVGRPDDFRRSIVCAAVMCCQIPSALRAERHERRTARCGWYDDPSGQFVKRYWDGDSWTDHVTLADGSAGRSGEPSQLEDQSVPI